MKKVLMPMLLLTSLTIFAAEEEGTGGAPSFNAAKYHSCLQMYPEIEKNKVRQMCEQISINKSTSDGTGKPAAEEGTGRT